MKIRIAAVWLFALGGVALGQRAVSLGTTATYPAVMLSDLHLDPLHDPAKVPLLAKTPAAGWEAILAAPDSPDQAISFAALQKTCKGKTTGNDAPYTLFASALKASKSQAGGAKFVTVSGDLLVHDLDCRYRAAMGLEKNKSDDESVSAAFAEKTAVFVMAQVEKTFAGVPVYMALGNNDSRCNHNRMDHHDTFLDATAGAVVDGLVGVSAKERELAKETFESAGYYAVTMPPPMERTRLLVLDDIYMMAKFESCEANAKDLKGADEQLAWLTKELDAAKIRGERIWVLGHVPPTVNPKASVAKGPALCEKEGPDAYLSSDKLNDILIAHADVVKLGLFGHTHLDEFHLLGNVPIKVVPSVSNVDGNMPSFTVAQVAPSFAMPMDFAVYKASNVTGVGTEWPLEYDFDKTYKQSIFSSESLTKVIAEFRSDADGTGAATKAYRTHYFKGPEAWEMASHWQQYVCSIDHGTGDGFKACACAR